MCILETPEGGVKGEPAPTQDVALEDKEAEGPAAAAVEVGPLKLTGDDLFEALHFPQALNRTANYLQKMPANQLQKMLQWGLFLFPRWSMRGPLHRLPCQAVGRFSLRA